MILILAIGTQIGARIMLQELWKQNTQQHTNSCHVDVDTLLQKMIAQLHVSVNVPSSSCSTCCMVSWLITLLTLITPPSFPYLLPKLTVNAVLHAACTFLLTESADHLLSTQSLPSGSQPDISQDILTASPSLVLIFLVVALMAATDKDSESSSKLTVEV